MTITVTPKSQSFKVKISFFGTINVNHSRVSLWSSNSHDVAQLKDLSEAIPEIFSFDFYTEDGAEKVHLDLNDKKYHYEFDAS